MSLSNKILNIIESILNEEMTKEDYKKVLFNLLPLAKEGDVSKEFVDYTLEWSMNILKKNNRIQWYLRWYALSLALNIHHHELSSERKKKWGDLAYTLIGKYANKTGMSNGQVESAVTSIPSTELRARFEHYFDPNIVGVIQKIKDYSFQWQTPEQVLNDFHRFEDEYRAKTAGGIDPKVLIRPDQMEEEATNILEFPDGWVWWDLNTYKSKEESRSGNNCGTCEFQDSTLLSLRRPIKIGGEIWWKSELTAEFTDGGYIRQLRHGNDKPDNLYHPYIMKLLMEYDGINGFEVPDYQPHDTFSVDDLTEEEQEALEAKNSDLVSEPQERSRTYFSAWDNLTGDSEYLDANTGEEAVEETKRLIKGLSSDIYVYYTMGLEERDQDGNEYGSDAITEGIGEFQPSPECVEEKHNWVENTDVTDKVSENIPLEIAGEEFHIQSFYPEVCSHCGKYKAVVKEDSYIHKVKYHITSDEIKRTIEIPYQEVYTESDVISQEWIEYLKQSS